jgi:hypothetical protein
MQYLRLPGAISSVLASTAESGCGLPAWPPRGCCHRGPFAPSNVRLHTGRAQSAASGSRPLHSICELPASWRGVGTHTSTPTERHCARHGTSVWWRSAMPKHQAPVCCVRERGTSTTYDPLQSWRHLLRTFCCSAARGRDASVAPAARAARADAGAPLRRHPLPLRCHASAC